LAALLIDLDQRGLLAEMIVYCTGEFSALRVRPAPPQRSACLMTAIGRRRPAAGNLARPTCLTRAVQRSLLSDDVSHIIFHQLPLPTHQVQNAQVALFRFSATAVF
jgi:hypothetical protein